MMRRLLVILLVVVGLGAGLASLWVQEDRVRSWLSNESETAVPVTIGTIKQVVVAIGRVEPVTEVTVANKIPGRIKEVLVKEGDPVRIGQILLRFDDAEAKAQVTLAQARVVTAEAEVRRAARGLEAARARWVEVKSGARPQELEAAGAEVDQAKHRREYAELERERMRRLSEDGFVARSQFDAADTEAGVARARVKATEENLSLLKAGTKPETIDAAWSRVQEAEAEQKRAESQVVQARAELGGAQATLASTVVDSSVVGKVTRKLVEPGEAVDISMPLLILGDVRRVIIKAEVDETDVGKLALGQTAEVSADAYSGRVFPGTVIEIGQTVGKRKVRPEDPAKIQDMKVLETKIDVTESGRELKLGMTVDVRILAQYKERAVVIPRRLVPFGAREASVRVAGLGGSEPRRIEIGLRDDQHVEVVSGLRPGERIVPDRR
jgi:ABC exporter DevB family membrane fusion protein